MIGPQAYENMFYVKPVAVKYHTVEHDGVRFFYHIDWELFDTADDFKAWCAEDVAERGGMYADKRESV